MEKVKLNKSQDNYNLYDYMMNMQNKKFLKSKKFQTTLINSPILSKNIQEMILEIIIKEKIEKILLIFL